MGCHPALAIFTIAAPMIAVPLLFVILGHPLLAVDGWVSRREAQAPGYYTPAT